jgi:hypothetical protein
MDDNNKFLDAEEDAILEGRVATSEKDLDEIVKEQSDDDGIDEFDEEQEE